MKGTRDKEGNPPSSERSSASSLNDIVQQRHDELSGSSAHIPPPSSSPIHKPNDLTVEHGAHPILAGDEGGKREANHESHSYIPSSVGHKGHTKHGGGGEHNEKGTPIAWPQKVTHSPHYKTREDTARHGGDSGVTDVNFGEVEIVSNDGDQRGGCECGDEACKEGNPRKVEGSHVGVG